MQKFAALARNWAKSTERFSDDDILSASFGKGVTARRSDDGRVILDIEGKESMRWQDALKYGYVRLSR